MSQDSPRRLHAVVTGHVQGVNFRYFTLMRANELGLTGWVRNLHDRTVEVTAEGSRANLEELLKFLRVGPPAAHVLAVEVEWQTGTGKFSAFTIE
jgi:acylphosphatase